MSPTPPPKPPVAPADPPRGEAFGDQPAGPHRVDAAALEAFVRGARASGCRVLQADLAGARDKAGVLAAIAGGLALPNWFGGNLDALYDCLTDLQPDAGGLAIAISAMPALPARDAQGLMAVFADAIEAFGERGIRLQVAYTDAP
jgi:hypothetical protein